MKGRREASPFSRAAKPATFILSRGFFLFLLSFLSLARYLPPSPILPRTNTHASHIRTDTCIHTSHLTHTYRRLLLAAASSLRLLLSVVFYFSGSLSRFGLSWLSLSVLGRSRRKYSRERETASPWLHLSSVIIKKTTRETKKNFKKKLAPSAPSLTPLYIPCMLL